MGRAFFFEDGAKKKKNSLAKLKSCVILSADTQTRVIVETQAQKEKKMKDYTMILKYADTVLGRILTNHGLTIDEALNLLDIDMDKYAEEQGWEGWDYEQLSLELEEEKND